MSSNYVQVGTRVVTRDSYEAPSREMGYVTGVVVALRLNLKAQDEITDDEWEERAFRSPVELAVVWDHQTDANPLDPSDSGTHAPIDYEWVPVSEVVTAPETPHAYIGTSRNPFGDVPGMTRF